MPGCDPTKAKKKKGKGKKKSTVTVKADSFFNFFETVETEKKEEKSADGGKIEEEKVGDEEETEHDDYDRDPQAEQMEQDFDLGTTIRDELVPNGLEYYLGVVQEDSDDSNDWGDDDDDESDADNAAKKNVKHQGKEECKQQ